MRGKKITALAGGVGGAKLVYGLSKILEPDDLKVIVNTGDDFSYYGLAVSPDIDSVVYSLAGIADPIHGYGRKDDSFNVFHTLKELGDNPWFKLGDKDLGLNVKRTQLLNSGMTLSYVTKNLCNSLGVNVSVIPMTNDTVYTKINTYELGEMDFQEYFVKNQFQPRVQSICYQNIENAILSPDAKIAIEEADVIIICPSNPWLSIFPIIYLPEVIDLLSKKEVVAISPIIGSKAVKGPTAKLFEEFGKIPNSYGIAKLYGSIIKTFVIDLKNFDEKWAIEQLGIKVHVTDIIMMNEEQKIRLAQEIIDLIKG